MSKENLYIIIVRYELIYKPDSQWRLKALEGLKRIKK